MLYDTGKYYINDFIDVESVMFNIKLTNKIYNRR